jgi:hypothetical protein
MDFFLLIISIPIMYFTIRGVKKRYNNHDSFKERRSYYSDVLGMLCGIGLFIVSLLRIFGYDIK